MDHEQMTEENQPEVVALEQPTPRKSRRLWCVLAFVVWIALIVYKLEFDFDLLSPITILYMFAFLGAIVWYGVVCVIAWRRQLKLFWIPGGILFFIMISAMLVAASIGRSQKSISIERAEPIIAGLEKYKEKHGVYPEKLEELVPDYLAEIPRSCMGITARPYRYSYPAHPKLPGVYRLSFQTHCGTMMMYRSDGHRWFPYD